MNGSRHRRRPALSHLLVGLAVVLAFILNLLALQGRGDTVMVAVAGQPIPAGEPLSPTMVKLIPVSTGFEGLPSLIPHSEIESLAGWLVQRPLPEGGLIERSNLSEPAAAGLRSMSIPVAMARASGGGIRPGDRVDIISVRDGEGRFVASDVAVLSVGGGGTGFSSMDFHLVLAVTAEQAIALAEAMAAGPVDVVRSTGAPPVDEGVGP
jgi:Flp pilus assembly protein CpaB